LRFFLSGSIFTGLLTEPRADWLRKEEANSYRERRWDTTKHNLDLIFERDGRAYGIEVKNTLGYVDGVG
jgi:hypothetical protein